MHTKLQKHKQSSNIYKANVRINWYKTQANIRKRP